MRDEVRALRRLRKYAITGLDLSKARTEAPGSTGELNDILGASGGMADIAGTLSEWRWWHDSWPLAGGLLLTRPPTRLVRSSEASADIEHPMLALADVMAVACRLQTTLGEAAAAIQEVAQEIHIPSLPEGWAGVTVQREVFETLIDEEQTFPGRLWNGEEVTIKFRWKRLGPGSIIRGAVKGRHATW